MRRSRRQIEEAVAHGAQQPVVHVHAQKQQHDDALVEERHHGGIHLRLRIEDVDQRIAHLNAQHLAGELHRLKDHVGRDAHAHADQELQ